MSKKLEKLDKIEGRLKKKSQTEEEVVNLVEVVK